MSPLKLFNLREDIAEKKNLAGAHPKVVEQLLAHAERARKELGDGDQEGAGQRPAGWVEKAEPLLKK